MNESIPIIEPFESTPLPPPYKDRKTGLMIFGILTIMLGGIVALFVVLIGFGMAVSAGMPNAAPVSSMLLAALFYGLLAVALVWLGIGSITAKRWARALLLIFSTTCLVMGVPTMVMMAMILPKTMANLPTGPGQPAIPIGPIMVGMMMVFGIVFIAIPGAWVFFYGSRDVKATCEARDLTVRWTDACPLPVLAISLWLALGVPMMLLMPVFGMGVIPFFGNFLSGPPGALACLVMAGVWGYAAWALYKLDARGWWVVLIAMCLYMVSSVMTYARHDVTEIYQLMHYPQEQIDQIQKSGAMTNGTMLGMASVFMVVFLGYLLFIRRYLRARVA